MRSTTPSEINESVRTLQKHIRGALEPIFLDLELDPAAEKLDCFNNVERRIQIAGGSVRYGWCVWLWEGNLVEGEFHAVWQSPDGNLHDITPKPDGEERILFIPDTQTTYNREPIDNIRVALSDDSEVLSLIAAGQKMATLRRQYNDGSGRSQIPISAILGELPHAQQPREPKIGRNSPCPCGSGRKYKKCCLV